MKAFGVSNYIYIEIVTCCASAVTAVANLASQLVMVLTHAALVRRITDSTVRFVWTKLYAVLNGPTVVAIIIAAVVGVIRCARVRLPMMVNITKIRALACRRCRYWR